MAALADEKAMKKAEKNAKLQTNFRTGNAKRHSMKKKISAARWCRRTQG
jgi:hypothetical protein